MQQDDPYGVRLTDDLLIEILTRLPVKSFYRCKCVSRSWRRLIGDSYVSARLPPIVSGVFYRRSGCSEQLRLEPRYGCNSGGSFLEADLSYLPFRGSSSIIDFSDGLLLFYSTIPSAYHVCNPTTRRWARLPRPSNKSTLSVLAFDASRSPHYKVVCFGGWQARGGRLEIFSSETGGWMEHGPIDWGTDTGKLSASMHYFGGVLYVIAYPGNVACIDLEKMRCSVIELPEEMKDATLGNSGGFLRCAMRDAEEMRIWALRDSKWELKSRVGIKGILEWNRKAFGDVLNHGQLNFLAFHPKEEVVYFWVMGRLVSLDLRKERLRMVCEMGAEEEEEERVQLIQIWLFPFSNCVSDSLA